MELPQGLYQVNREERVKPCPFTVIECDQIIIKDWVNFFDNNGHYKKTLTIQTRPIKEIRLEETHPKTLSFRQYFKDIWESSTIIARETKTLPVDGYDGPCPISTPKWKDL